jgi:hypothetical protein
MKKIQVKVEYNSVQEEIQSLFQASSQNVEHKKIKSENLIDTFNQEE